MDCCEFGSESGEGNFQGAVYVLSRDGSCLCFGASSDPSRLRYDFCFADKVEARVARDVGIRYGLRPPC